MRLLYVTEGVPNRDPVLGDGSSMIPYEIVEHLADVFTVDLVAFGDVIEPPSEVRRRCESVTVLPLRGWNSSVVRSVLLRSQIGTEQRTTTLARNTVRTSSRAADVTLIHGPHAAFLAAHVEGPVVIQAVDPWSLRMEMEVGLTSGWRSQYRALKARHARAAERRLPERARLLTVGREDARMWSSRLGRRVMAISNGTACLQRSRHRDGPPTVCFLGSLNYAPNVESALILIRDIAPQVWAHAPDVRFVVAGRQPDRALLRLAGDRVHVLANVSDVRDVFNAADIAAFPDVHGVGIRNSVSEALAAGLPVVATPAAARGQEPHPLLHVVDRGGAFVHRVLDLLSARDETDATHAEVRTWSTVAREYIDECLEAWSAGAVAPPGVGRG